MSANHKFEAGDLFPNLLVTTAIGNSLNIPVPDARYTHVQFRRWTGCPMCNVHISSLRRNADLIRAAGIHEVLFFHSTQAQVVSFQKDLPFDAVGDPNKVYYRQLGVESSWKFALHPDAIRAMLLGMFRLRFNLEMTGGPMGLPADFLIAPDGKIKALKWGRHAADQWSVAELLALASPAHAAETNLTTAEACSPNS